LSTPAPVAEARAALAEQLAGWRQHAGLTQAQAGHRIGYSRSAVARAERTGVCSRDFCRAAGRLYGAGEQLALAHDRIEALAAAARSQAARQARQARQPLVMAQEETEITFAVSEGTCPYCGKPVAVLVRQSAALLQLESREGAR
jgi:transcriptional regulator with XRE-family HTH domain